MISSQKKIYISGHRGMVGSAVWTGFVPGPGIAIKHDLYGDAAFAGGDEL